MNTEPKETKEQIQRRQMAERFLRFDQKKMIQLFSLDHDENSIRITFLGKEYTIDREAGSMYLNGQLADLDATASVFELLTKSEHLPMPVGRWESIASLCTNTTDTSLTRYIEYLEPFHDDIPKMQNALLALGAEPASKGDVSAVLEIYPGISVWVQYWIADDEFPASIQFLFDAKIEDHFRWSLLWNVMTTITNRMKEAAGID